MLITTKLLFSILFSFIMLIYVWFRQRNRKAPKPLKTILKEQFLYLMSFTLLFLSFSEFHNLEKIAKSGTLPADYMTKLTETIKWFAFISIICFASIYDKQMKLLKQQTTDLEKRIKKLEGSPYIP